MEDATDGGHEVRRLRTKQHAPQSQSPADRAILNTTHVILGRVTGELDAEQTEQAIEALNGVDKSDE